LADSVAYLIDLLRWDYFNALYCHGVRVLSKSIIMIKLLKPLQQFTITQLMMFLKQ